MINIDERELEEAIIKLKAINKTNQTNHWIFSSFYLKMLREIRKLFNTYKNEEELIKKTSFPDILDYQDTFLFSKSFINYAIKNYRN